MSDVGDFVREKLGHDPKDVHLFELALTHSSVGGESYDIVGPIQNATTGLEIGTAHPRTIDRDDESACLVCCAIDEFGFESRSRPPMEVHDGLPIEVAKLGVGHDAPVRKRDRVGRDVRHSCSPRDCDKDAATNISAPPVASDLRSPIRWRQRVDLAPDAELPISRMVVLYPPAP